MSFHFSMPKKLKTVISASRRTDIPAFYMDSFMQGINQGYFEVPNPYNRKISTVQASPEFVHTIVFWSKNFAPFLEGGYGERLINCGYNLYFNFTINAENQLLEPNVPPLDDRLTQVAELARRFRPEAVAWRFDPLCFYNSSYESPASAGKIEEGIVEKKSKEVIASSVENNLKGQEKIADHVSRAGVNRCITSFYDEYAKIKKRLGPGFTFIDPAIEKKVEILKSMQEMLAQRKISLFTCCEGEVMDALGAGTGIQRSSCIPSDYLEELFGPGISTKKDSGQRVKQGCGCMVSRDIGSYRDNPCFHNCLFCYANPSASPKAKEAGAGVEDKA